MLDTIEKTDMMQSVDIHNEELLELLEEFVQFFKKVPIETSRSCQQDMLDRHDEYCSDEYLHRIRKLWNAHDGYPELLTGVGFENGRIPEVDYDNKGELVAEYTRLTSKLNSWTGSKRNALFAIYPPGGYISWHNNANCDAYNVLFTWSEEGKGRWKHWDPKTREIVTIEDKPGWKCKFGYYGAYHTSPDGKEIVYHMAETECLRATVAFIFNVDETGKKMVEMLLEEIQTP